MIRLHHCAVGIGLALFLAPSLLLARPMTQEESRCFEYSEAVYQAVTPREWDSVEPYPVAEVGTSNGRVPSAVWHRRSGTLRLV